MTLIPRALQVVDEGVEALDLRGRVRPLLRLELVPADDQADPARVQPGADLADERRAAVGAGARLLDARLDDALGDGARLGRAGRGGERPEEREQQHAQARRTGLICGGGGRR